MTAGWIPVLACDFAGCGPGHHSSICLYALRPGYVIAKRLNWKTKFPSGVPLPDG
jgi:hypothetical protein